MVENITRNKARRVILVDSKELFEFQNATIKHYKKAINDIRERFEVGKTLDKQIETILSYLETYEIMYDTLNKVREFSSECTRSKELEAIEGEMKVLNDTFWN